MKNVYLLLFLFFTSCGLLSENTKPVQYSSESFVDFKVTESPDYSNTDSWAIHPKTETNVFEGFNQEKENLQVDTFFIYPTLLTDKNNTRWNADIFNVDTRNYVLNSSVKFQASAWYSVGDLYVLYYRHAHIRFFIDSFSSIFDKFSSPLKNAASSSISSTGLIFSEKVECRLAPNFAKFCKLSGSGAAKL